jgi:hypothetical protein
MVLALTALIDLRAPEDRQDRLLALADLRKNTAYFTPIKQTFVSALNF